MSGILEKLALVTKTKQDAEQAWNRLVREAIAEGHSERKIARAAGISGPAVNQRKKAAVIAR